MSAPLPETSRLLPELPPPDAIGLLPVRNVVRRRAARVLVLDEHDRLLLLRGFDPADPESGSWWFTPGGGLDPGETATAAAGRELFEETGLLDVQLDGPVWRRIAEFGFDGGHYRQEEVFFLARVPAGEVQDAGWSELERRSLLGFQWWTLDELAETADVVYPTTLARELRRLLRDGVPAEPLTVGP